MIDSFMLIIIFSFRNHSRGDHIKDQLQLLVKVPSRDSV